jgi:hypothetical protein
MGTEEAAGMEADADSQPAPRKIGKGTDVATVDPFRLATAHRAPGRFSFGADIHGDQRVGRGEAEEANLTGIGEKGGGYAKVPGETT